MAIPASRWSTPILSSLLAGSAGTLVGDPRLTVQLKRGGSGKVAGGVLCPFVVGKHRSHRRRRRVHSRVNWCECHVPAQPTRQLDEIPEPCGLVLEMWRSSVTSSGARSYRDSCPCPSPTSYPCADGCRSWVGGHDQGRDRGRERPRGTRDRVGANALSSCGQRDVHPCRRRHGEHLSRSGRAALVAVVQATHFR